MRSVGQFRMSSSQKQELLAMNAITTKALAALSVPVIPSPSVPPVRAQVSRDLRRLRSCAVPRSRWSPPHNRLPGRDAVDCPDPPPASPARLNVLGSPRASAPPPREFAGSCGTTSKLAFRDCMSSSPRYLRASHAGTQPEDCPTPAPSNALKLWRETPRSKV